MKKNVCRITIVLTICIAALSLTSCLKETWDFNYPKEQLCAGWWGATYYSPNGSSWTSLADLGEYNELRFWEDGDFSSIGMFEASAKTHTWEAHGNQIIIYMNNDKPLQTYTVQSWDGRNIELKMDVGSSTAYFKYTLK